MISINEDPDERRPLLVTGDQETGTPPASPSVVATSYGAVDKLPRVLSFQDVRTNIAAGMMDLSLFIANANQLANVIRTPEQVHLTGLEWTIVILICLSIFLQVFVVLLLIWSPPHRLGTAKTNRGTVTCIFLVLVINVFVACLNNEQQHYANETRPTVPCVPDGTRAIASQ